MHSYVCQRRWREFCDSQRSWICLIFVDQVVLRVVKKHKYSNMTVMTTWSGWSGEVWAEHQWRSHRVRLASSHRVQFVTTIPEHVRVLDDRTRREKFQRLSRKCECLLLWDELIIKCGRRRDVRRVVLVLLLHFPFLHEYWREKWNLIKTSHHIFSGNIMISFIKPERQVVKS